MSLITTAARWRPLSEPQNAGPSDDEMTNAETLVLSDDKHSLTGEWMERVGNRRLECQTPGIMSLPRIGVARGAWRARCCPVTGRGASALQGSLRPRDGRADPMLSISIQSTNYGSIIAVAMEAPSYRLLRGGSDIEVVPRAVQRRRA